MAERRSEDELRTRLRQQAAVADLGRRALTAGLDDLLREAVAVVASELGAPFTSIAEIDAGGGHSVRAFTTASDPATIESGAQDSGQIVHTLALAEPVISPDLAAEQRFSVADQLESGARSSASVPIGAGDRLFGVLTAASRRLDDFSDYDVNFLQGVANTLAAAVERERGEQSLRHEQARLQEALARVSESEARFRELADTAPVFIWTSDAEGLVDFINQSWLDFTGRPVEEELGDSWTVGVHSDDAEGVRRTWWSSFEGRVPWEREYRLCRHDGSYRWIVDRGLPRFVEGEFVGYVGTATDIHVRKEMEERLSMAYARDHEVAETLQRSLLPEHLPTIDDLELEARYLPAARGTAIGGDWYDAVELDDGRVAVVVGDVVGHGLRAAAMMGQLRNAFRAYALLGSPPAETLARLNRLLTVEGQDLMATVLYVVLDRDSCEVTYCSAGHPPPLLVTSTGSRFLEGGRSVPLGTTDPAVYRDAEDRIDPGATLLLYTDGLVERRDTPLNIRLDQLAATASEARGSLGQVCDAILSGILSDDGAPDDVALLAVRPEPSTSDRLVLKLAADPTVLAGLRRRLARFLNAAGASEEERFEITLTVCEAAANAIEHAYGPGDAEFDLELGVEDREIVASVRDHGSWREPQGADKAHGRGLGIIEKLMDRVELEQSEGGTTVRMWRKLRAAA